MSNSLPAPKHPLTNNLAIRLLISHNQMGTIIGRQGLKIKHIQDASGVRMVAQKEMLPQSTERIVEVQGTPEGIDKAIWEIGKCLVDDWQRGTGTVLYNPAVRVQVGSGPLPPAVGAGTGGAGAVGGGAAAATGGSYGGGGRSYNRTGNGADFSETRTYNRGNDNPVAEESPLSRKMAKKFRPRTSASLPIWSAASLDGVDPRSVKFARVRGPESRLPRRLMTILARECSPSWAVPAPTNEPCTCCTRTWRRRRVVDNRSRRSKVMNGSTLADPRTGRLSRHDTKTTDYSPLHSFDTKYPSPPPGPH